MRKALFALVLVAASFGGGAAVNGPGLRWAQAWTLGRLGLVESEIGPVAGPPAEDAGAIPPLNVDAPANIDKGAEPVADTKDSPAPEAGVHKGGGPARTAAASDAPIAPEPAVAGGPAPDRPATPPPLEVAPESRPAPLTALDDPEPRALPQPSPTATAANEQPHGATPAPAAVPSTRPVSGNADGAVALASLSRTGPGPGPVETPAESGAVAGKVTVPPQSSPPADAAMPHDPTDWAEVRRELKALGVSRYGLEGEPSGRVRFYCVIPLAGRRAVGQHFEAEADDELQAARAALRRVVLWRASESATP